MNTTNLRRRLEQALTALGVLEEDIAALAPSDKGIPLDIYLEWDRITDRLSKAAINTELDAGHLKKIVRAASIGNSPDVVQIGAALKRPAKKKATGAMT